MRRFCAIILLLTTTTQACVRWVHTDAAVPDVVATPTDVRVQRTDATTMVLRRARMQQDSIVGTMERAAPMRSGSGVYETVRGAVALRDVRSIAVERRDVGRTLLLVGTIATVLLVTFIAATNDLGEFTWEQMAP